MKIDDKIASELFRQYGKRLYNTALRITLSSYEAEEIMQDTLIRFLTGGNRPAADMHKQVHRLPAPGKTLREHRRCRKFIGTGSCQ